MACFNDTAAGWFPGLNFQLNTASLSSTVASAGQLTGSALCVMNNAGATPGTYTTRSATLMIGDASLVLGSFWLILLVNGQGTGTLTLAGGSGVTAGGTLTVAGNTARLFTAQVTSTSTPAITITGLALSFTATALAFGV